MTEKDKDLIRKMYEAFNSRDIDTVLKMMHEDVHWPNGWEGGYVDGHEALRAYWTRQWKEISPQVQPLSIGEREDGCIEVKVHQVGHDKQGNELFNLIVSHLYTFDNGLIKSMEIDHGS